ncbi:MAG: thioesterase family protein [Legionella sp.]|nr:thioesterase family protein [Legionella sp.]
MTLKKLAIHQKIFAIEWGQMDALGHVNNARYFDYFQEARIEWLASLQVNLREGAGPVIVHTACTFLKPVIYPATLTLNSSIHSIGRSSFVIDHELFQDEQLMAEGSCKIVWVDYSRSKSISLPDKIRHLFQ